VTDQGDHGPGGRFGRGAAIAGMYAEVSIYAAVSLVLTVGAAVVLIDAVITYFSHVSDSVATTSIELLSALLLVFVFVELLSATRVTIREQRLIAEPFLLVGIIASIKEIVVVASSEDSETASWETLRNSLLEIGVLAGVILVLSISALLLRRREREPTEEARGEDAV
jgi:uncharacterized membrane protein (DUF373 family)